MLGCCQFSQPADEVVAGCSGVFDEPLFLEHIQHGQTRRCSDGVSTEGGEEASVALEFFQYRATSDHHAERVAVTDGFSQSDDVWVIPTSGESPEVQSPIGPNQIALRRR